MTNPARRIGLFYALIGCLSAFAVPSLIFSPSGTLELVLAWPVQVFSAVSVLLLATWFVLPAVSGRMIRSGLFSAFVVVLIFLGSVTVGTLVNLVLLAGPSAPTPFLDYVVKPWAWISAYGSPVAALLGVLVRVGLKRAASSLDG